MRVSLPFLFALNRSLRRRSSDEGLTLLECLVAIIVVTIMILAITPPIFLSAATRIQTRKAERALQVAQGEIDRVRLVVERGKYLITQIPADAQTQNLDEVGVATGAPTNSDPLQSPANCNTYPGTAPVSYTSLVRVDVDGDCVPEYAMQVFRTTGQTPSGSSVPIAFEMGVRVYSYSPGQAFPTLEAKPTASLLMGTTNRENVNGKRRPIAAKYSTLARNDSSKSLAELCKSAGGTSCNF